jgi:hypothetical protein
MRHSARAFEKLADTLEQEVPDTAAALRLTGMELNDCIEEVALLRYSRVPKRLVSPRMLALRWGACERRMCIVAPTVLTVALRHAVPT